MKKLIISVLFLLSIITGKAQTLDSNFVGILSPIVQTGTYVQNGLRHFQFQGIFRNNLGQFQGADAPSNDMVLVMPNNGQCYELPIVQITAGSVITGTVTDPSGELASLPAGTAFIGQKTEEGFILEADMLPREMTSCIENHFRKQVGGNSSSGGGGADKHITDFSSQVFGSQILYTWTYNDGTTLTRTGAAPNGLFSATNNGSLTSTFSYKLGGHTAVQGEGKDYRMVNLNIHQFGGKEADWFYSDKVRLLTDGDLTLRSFGDFTVQNNTGKIFFKNSQFFQGMTLEKGFTWSLVDPLTMEVEFAAPIMSGYKVFDFGAEKSASVTGDTTGVQVSFFNNTWTIDMSNSMGIENVNLIGTIADYTASNQVFIEIIGGKGNTSYESIRLPDVTKGDFSAKQFGSPSVNNPYLVDVDNNPQSKVVEIGVAGFPKIKMRYEGMNAYSHYCFSIKSL